MTARLRETPPAMQDPFVCEPSHQVDAAFQEAISALATRCACSSSAPTMIPALVELIRAHAGLQSLLGQVSETDLLDCGAYLSELGCALPDALPCTSAIAVMVDAEPVLLQPMMGRLLGLLVHGLALNAAKHAIGSEGGAVTVRLRQVGTHVLCSVRDNGLNLTEADPAAHGRGMILVQLLAQQASGTCFWHARICGTKAVVTFDLRSPSYDA